MADVILAPQKLSDAGVAPTYTGSLSVANTYIVRNSGRVFLHFKKTGAGANTTTVQTPKTVGGLAVADRTVNVPGTTGDVMVGPLSPDLYNDAIGDLRFTLSEITGLSVAVLEL